MPNVDTGLRARWKSEHNALHFLERRGFRVCKNTYQLYKKLPPDTKEQSAIAYLMEDHGYGVYTDMIPEAGVYPREYSHNGYLPGPDRRDTTLSWSTASLSAASGWALADRWSWPDSISGSTYISRIGDPTTSSPPTGS